MSDFVQLPEEVLEVSQLAKFVRRVDSLSLIYRAEVTDDYVDSSCTLGEIKCCPTTHP